MSQQRIQRKPSANFLGETKYYIKDPLGFLQKHQSQLGDAFGFRLAHRTIYFVNDPELYQLSFIKAFKMLIFKHAPTKRYSD